MLQTRLDHGSHSQLVEAEELQAYANGVKLVLLDLVPVLRIWSSSQGLSLPSQVALDQYSQDSIAPRLISRRKVSVRRLCHPIVTLCSRCV